MGPNGPAWVGVVGHNYGTVAARLTGALDLQSSVPSEPSPTPGHSICNQLSPRRSVVNQLALGADPNPHNASARRDVRQVAADGLTGVQFQFESAK